MKTQDDMTIRPIKEEDVPNVIQLILRNWDEVLSKHHSSAVVEKFRGEVTPNWMMGQMKWKQIFLVESDSEIVATGALANFGSQETPKHSVSQFFVRPDQHGRGIGKLLMDYLVRTARSKGIRQLHVPSTSNAIPFYQRVGFTKDTCQLDSADEITWMTMEI